MSSHPTAPLPPTPRAAPSSAETLSRNLAFYSLLALFVLCLAWELWLAPVGRGTLAIKALPLLVPLAGLWRYRLYTFRWLSLMVWLYVAEGLVRATSDRGLSAWLAGLEVLLGVLIFVACSMQVRQRLAAARAANAQPEA
ncbi:DUF2069 domain-containing protein [Roseateles sp. DB2]|uniref:DUF2069 domain-containing protein n=1 Tax=Roseateles sp. DB2 TaxID=3453717 RepID=UPI003EED2C94